MQDVQQKTPDEIAARRRAYDARQAADREQPAKGASQGPQGTERALYEQEQAHRLRLGRIARLRALLGERGDTQKLAKLDEIAAKENLRYQRFTDIQKRKLAPDESVRADKQLERGRQRSHDQRTPRDEALQREERERNRERAERQRQKQDTKPPKPDSSPAREHPAPQIPKPADKPVIGARVERVQ
jgi:hypothetical protein